MRRICVGGGGQWGQNHIRTLHELDMLGGIVEVDSKQALGAAPGGRTTPGEVRRLIPPSVRFRGVNGSHRLDVTTVHDPAGSVGQACIPSQSLIASGCAVPGAPVVDGESGAIHHESPEVLGAGNVDMCDRRIGLAGDQVAGDSAHGTLGQDEWLIDHRGQPSRDPSVMESHIYHNSGKENPPGALTPVGDY